METGRGQVVLATIRHHEGHKDDGGDDDGDDVGDNDVVDDERMLMGGRVDDGGTSDGDHDVADDSSPVLSESATPSAAAKPKIEAGQEKAETLPRCSGHLSCVASSLLSSSNLCCCFQLPCVVSVVVVVAAAATVIVVAVAAGVCAEVMSSTCSRAVKIQTELAGATR